MATDKILISRHGDCRLFETTIANDCTSDVACRNDAVERLLTAATGSDHTLCHTASGAPYLAERQEHISISHSRNFACLAVCDSTVVGVDVEQARDQLWRVAERFLSQAELKTYGQSMALLLRAWTLKEALYKAALTDGLDFRKDICLPVDPSSDTVCLRGINYRIISVDQTPERTIALVSRENNIFVP